MASGWVHFAVGVCFLLGAVAVDVDHFGTCKFSKILDAFNGDPNSGCSRGIFHTPILFWCLFALTIGLFIHLKLDGLI